MPIKVHIILTAEKKVSLDNLILAAAELKKTKQM